MFPLSDRNPHRTTPWVTYVIIVVNIVFFFLEITGGDDFIIRWSFLTSRFLENPLRDFPTLFTSMFMHAGWLHIGGNMLYLWIFGDNVEDMFGHFKFLLFYLFCGLVAGFAQMAFHLNSMALSMGASGAVAGVLGAYILMFPLAPVRVLLGCFVAPLPALVVIGVWIVLQFFYGVGSLGSVTEGGVAYMAHIGGFIAGLIIAIIYRLSKRGKLT
ncbi:MAG: rhomboid family intramembrane serine protease [Dehalococcoidales bacterium]|nr:rhomboid family intramembrane serine protease [Dehalococcoidales bacterium]